jgi:diguanylate cyclase (GGDEF)-like protein/PAS domain S-box-containing protein
MLKVIGCIVEQHDYRLVALAALICALASYAAVAVLSHARRTRGRARYAWIAVAAAASGSGIWATHFIAMLAFLPPMPVAYELWLTVFSFAYAVIIAGAGFAITVLGSRRRLAAPLGGLVVGGGIAAMHYTGMAAFVVAGRLSWDPALVAASIAFGGLFGALAMAVAMDGTSRKRMLAAAGLLVVAIVSHHFTAMGAVTITPDPTMVIPESAVPKSWLAMAVALTSFTLLIMAGAALMIDVRDRRHASLEQERLRSLADAAVEGLVVCRGDTIVSANESFHRLVGGVTPTSVAAQLSDYVPDARVLALVAHQPETPIEAELRQTDGGFIPVELIMRPIHYANQPHFAVAVRDVRARRKAERQIHFLAHHDALTGLANRASFNARLDQEMKAADIRGHKLAVLCLDLDRFKEVNDLFGHAAGDAVLERVARTVTGLLDGSQVMARLGGDEFAILAPCEHAVAASRLAEIMLEALRAENAAIDGPVVATSIGIAIYPDDAAERNTLLNFADTALYRAKAEGRGTYRFFEASMGVEVRDRRLLEHDLRHAIARGELDVHYQPQSDTATGRVFAFEALVRWRHPERGYVSPTVFIPIAEETGIILQIGEWILSRVCHEAATWANHLSVAINISAVQIHSPNLVRSVHEALLRSGLSPARLEVEVTETALIRDPSRALATLSQLKALGIRIAMDDFGTGYSSLSNLRSFPFDKIKIDGSFIKSVDSNEQTAAIVRSVLGLGRGLGLPVLAEGVETKAELEFLIAENCQEAQGYLMGRPGPIEQFADITGGKRPDGKLAAVA